MLPPHARGEDGIQRRVFPILAGKAERIHKLATKAYDDFGEGTSLEALHGWPSAKIRTYLMGINGLARRS